MRNRPFYQTGFGAKLTSLIYWIWCEIYLFTLLNLVRNRPKFGAKSTFLPLWIWCEINLNLVPNRHTIWCEIDRIPSRRKWVLVQTKSAAVFAVSMGGKKYDFAPKSYDFAPNLPHQIITISHQISLRFRTKKLRFRTKSPRPNYYDFAPNL